MTKRQRERKERLLPNGEPRYVRIYDGGEELLDRYSVIFTGNYTDRTSGQHYLTVMSETPLVPGGFFQHDMHPYQCDCIRTSKAKGRTEGNWPPAMGRKCHLGLRIPFSDLNDECKKAVLQDYAELWEIE